VAEFFFFFFSSSAQLVLELRTNIRKALDKRRSRGC